MAQHDATFRRPRHEHLVPILLLGWMAIGCSLPAGKLASAHPTDADASTQNSGIRPIDAPTSGTSARSAEAGDAGGVAADSGVRSKPGDAIDATLRDASMPALKSNGDGCDASADCASANCKKGPTGDKHCYGTIARGRDCNGQYDCDGYSCIPRKHGETQGVCVDASACARDACRQAHALAFCQLDQTCSAAPMDFGTCYATECASDADAGCSETESVEQHLNEIGCCPPAGVSEGTCDTSPQCGCADDQKCDADHDGPRTHCGPIGSNAESETCLKDFDCQKGFTCRGHLCKRYCDGPDDDRCSKGACIPSLTDDKPDPGIFLCTRSCDPTAPSVSSDRYVGCGTGQGCDPSADGNSDCFSTTGTGMQGDSCADDKGEADGFKCAPTYACIIPDNKCEKLCKVQGGTCSVGACHSFAGKLYAGSIEIGHCE